MAGLLLGSPIVEVTEITTPIATRCRDDDVPDDHVVPPLESAAVSREDIERLGLDFFNLSADVKPTGSRFICFPPPTDTDEDWLVLCKDSKVFIANAIQLGYETSLQTGQYEGMPLFFSMRGGVRNLIVTQNSDFFDRFWAATVVARRLNLLQKKDRVALFQAVLYGKIYDP